MKDLALWQQITIALAALVLVGGMQVIVWRYLVRDSDGTASERPGTDLEAMLYGADAPAGSRVFDGFSYRVSARFAGRVRVVASGDRVTVCGPRGPQSLYAFWIWLQATLMAAAPVALVWAIVALDWRVALWGLGLVIASTLVMAIGAGVWPGLGEVPGLTDGHMPALEFGQAGVHDVTLGKGWANGGLSVILLPYVGGIDNLAIGHAVSWWGPDERGREVRYAVHCYKTEDAEQLYEILRGFEQQGR